MKVLLLLVFLSQADDVCRVREFRCELRCNGSTQGGSMSRLDCYTTCRSEEQYCRREWPQ